MYASRIGKRSTKSSLSLIFRSRLVVAWIAASLSVTKDAHSVISFQNGTISSGAESALRRSIACMPLRTFQSSPVVSAQLLVKPHALLELMQMPSPSSR
jgi:hypothetical protein